MESDPKKSPVPAAEKIQRQLERILASPEFKATDRQRDFLRFVVLKTLAGKAHEIKGYSVATGVFGRGHDFNQATDPIVSVQAKILRRAMERYYLVAGKQDPLTIDIPKGAFVPTFKEKSGIEPDVSAGGGEGLQAWLEGSWPTVLVRPFQNLTGDPQLSYLAIGLATELAIEITRYQDVRVLMVAHQEDERRQVGRDVAQFAIHGSVRKDRVGVKVAVQLVDPQSGSHIWGDMHRSNLEAAELIAFQEVVAQVIAAKIASEHGVISKTLSAESRNKPPSELKTYEAILRYYEFDATLSVEASVRALEALKHAAAIEPGCGQIWTMLGRIYAVNYSTELFDLPTPLEEAIEFAQKGARLDPDNQRARTILAFVRMLGNEISAALAEIERALALNPNSLYFLEGIGFLMTLLGQWERGPALLRKAIELNPYHRLYVHHALWVDWIRQKDYEQAYLETLNFRRPSNFWEPLMRTATLGLLGRLNTGQAAGEELLKLKPDFLRRGRGLIKHYIKFDNLVERIVSGLRNAGVKVE